MITQERLKELLEYHPDSGDFVRKIGRKGVAAGSIAGTTNSYFGYIAIYIDGKSYKAHRLAFLYMEGRIPTEEVDHINGDRTDNSWDNLKEVSRKENAHNCAMRKDNTSGIVGIGFHTKRNQWRARIGLEHIGWFSTKEEAIVARQSHPLNKNFSDRHGKDVAQFNNSYKANK